MARKPSNTIERDDSLDEPNLSVTESGGSGVGGDGGGGGGDRGGDGGDRRVDPATLGGPGPSGEPGAGTDSAGTAFDPGKHTGRRNVDGTWRLKKKNAKVHLGRELPVSTIEMFLVASHMAMANLLSAPELELKGSEPRDLAVPLQKVAGLYNMTVDPRLEAYGMLIIAAVSVYGPKLQTMRARVKATKGPKMPPGQRPPPPSADAPTPIIGNGEIVFGKLN